MIVEPRNEAELIILFAQRCVSESGIEIVSFYGTFPDAVVSWDGKMYKTEFEHLASNFVQHEHNPLKCDLVICWHDDNPEFILPVIAMDDPHWRSANIEAISNSEKTASYWKKRALEAESELKLIKDGEVFVTPEIESRILEMSREKLSNRAISEAIWQQRGTFYNNRIRAVLSKHQLGNQA